MSNDDSDEAADCAEDENPIAQGMGGWGEEGRGRDEEGDERVWGYAHSAFTTGCFARSEGERESVTGGGEGEG